MTSGFSKSDLLRSPKRKSGVALSKAIRTYPQYTKSKTWHPRLICLLGQATAAAAGVASGVETDPGTSRKQDVKVLRAFENAGITKSLGTECQALAFGLLKSPLQAFGSLRETRYQWRSKHPWISSRQATGGRGTAAADSSK